MTQFWMLHWSNKQRQQYGLPGLFPSLISIIFFFIVPIGPESTVEPSTMSVRASEQVSAWGWCAKHGDKQFNYMTFMFWWGQQQKDFCKSIFLSVIFLRQSKKWHASAQQWSQCHLDRDIDKIKYRESFQAVYSFIHRQLWVFSSLYFSTSQ